MLHSLRGLHPASPTSLPFGSNPLASLPPAQEPGAVAAAALHRRGSACSWIPGGAAASYATRWCRGHGVAVGLKDSGLCLHAMHVHAVAADLAPATCTSRRGHAATPCKAIALDLPATSADAGAAVATTPRQATPVRPRRSTTSKTATFEQQEQQQQQQQQQQRQQQQEAVPRLSDPATLKVSELQAALKALGLPVSGRKAELVERLLAVQETATAPADGVVQVPLPALVPEAPTQQRRRTRARTTSTSSSEEAAGTGGIDGLAAEEGARAVIRRRATPKRGTAAAGSTAGVAGGAEEPADPFLDELFAAMDLEISVETRDPREIQAQVTAMAPPPASQPPPGDLGRARSRDAATETDSDKLVDSVWYDAAQEGQRRRRTGQMPAAAAVAEPAAEQRANSRAARRVLDAGPGPSAAAAVATAAAAAASATSGADVPPAAPPTVSAPSSTSRSTRDPDLDLEMEMDHEYDLPPWPPMFMGEMKSLVQLAPGDREAQEELLLSNVPGMSLTVLGSAAVRPTAARALASLAMGRVKDIFIFDAGDDTQRQVAHAYHVKPSKIYRIFLTSLEPESVLGLPGLMCIINSSRERGHEVADIPVHVYGPPGTADFLGAMMRVSHTCLEVTIIVHEISTGPVAPSESHPYLYVKRARIWRVVMPPDQLNPRGGVDASLLLFAPDQGRSQKKRGRNSSGGVLSFDPRAGFLPFPPLEPGNPYSRRDADPLTMSWTLELDITARVIINMLPGARGSVLSYTVQEADRAGALVLERATAAGLVGGPDFSRLKAGETVKNSWGLPVPPSLVITPDRPGRRVVVLGNTTDPSALTRAGRSPAAGADVLVAGAVWPRDEASLAAAAGGCTTDQLGDAARRLGVRYVLLSRYDGRRLDEQEGYAERIADEVTTAAATVATAALGSATPAERGQGRSVEEWRRRVFALSDLESVLVDKNEGPKERCSDTLATWVA